VFQQIACCFTKIFSIVSGLRKCFSKVKNETSSEKSVFNTIFSVKSGQSKGMAGKSLDRADLRFSLKSVGDYGGGLKLG